MSALGLTILLFSTFGVAVRWHYHAVSLNWNLKIRIAQTKIEMVQYAINRSFHVEVRPPILLFNSECF